MSVLRVYATLEPISSNTKDDFGRDTATAGMACHPRRARWRRYGCWPCCGCSKVRQFPFAPQYSFYKEALKPSNEAISESFALGLQRLAAGSTPRRRQETKTLVDVEDSCCYKCRTVLCRAEFRGDYAHFSEGCRER